MTEKDLTTFDCCKGIENDYPFCPEGKYYNAVEVHKLLAEKEAYIEQLRGEVSKWHKAYDALLVERNALAHELHTIKKTLTEGA